MRIAPDGTKLAVWPASADKYVTIGQKSPADGLARPASLRASSADLQECREVTQFPTHLSDVAVAAGGTVRSLDSGQPRLTVAVIQKQSEGI